MMGGTGEGPVERQETNMEYTIKRPESPCYLAMEGEPDGKWTDNLWSAWGGNQHEAMERVINLLIAQQHGTVTAPGNYEVTFRDCQLVLVEIRRGAAPGQLVEGAIITL